MGNDESNHGDSPEDGGPDEAAAPPAPTSPISLEEQLRAEIDRNDKLEKDKRELHDRLLRTAAEFENFKKRTKKEADEASTRGREQLLKELLPAVDNLERALKHAAPGDPLAVGVQQTEKLLLQALEKFGVVRFASVGKPFDPSMHDAIQQVETNEHAPGVVAQEFASGYMIGQRLLRPAMVAVAKAPVGAGE
ncbi:MAG TPA: nucleotide exchange factor GrpE [Polyangia bacterium]|jgi:molecular chaperone GrpE